MDPTAGSAITSEMRLLEAAKPESAWKVVLPRKTDVEYEMAHRGDHLFILLRDPERPNSELLVAPLSDPTKTTVGLSWPYSYSRHSDGPVTCFHRASKLRAAHGAPVRPNQELGKAPLATAASEP